MPEGSADGSEGTVPADGITDFGVLYPRQTGFVNYSVLSLAGDDPTAYRVNISELECDCPDFQHQHGSAETICKHLAVAIFEAPGTVSLETWAARDLSGIVAEARDAVDALENSRDVAQAKASANAAAGSSGSAEGASAGQSETANKAPVVRVRDWLEDAGIDVSNMEVWEHDEYDSIQFATDGQLPQDQFETLKSLSDHDLVKWDSNSGNNFVRADDVDEVVG